MVNNNNNNNKQVSLILINNYAIVLYTDIYIHIYILISFIIEYTSKYFRGCPRKSPAKRSYFIVYLEFGQPKISYFNVEVGIYKQVVALQIAVDDQGVVGMKVVHSLY